MMRCPSRSRIAAASSSASKTATIITGIILTPLQPTDPPGLAIYPARVGDINLSPISMAKT